MRWGTYEAIDADLAEGVLTLRLNLPDRLNAVGRQLHEELSWVFIEAARDNDVDIIVLTGAGRAFSAGGDFDFLQHTIDNPQDFDEVAFEGRQIVYAMLECDKPIIGKINGHAIGLGATLALFCDIIFMADHARIADPHVRIGLVAGDGGAVIWPQLIGYARAKEFLMTGDALTAPRAAEIGLINYAVPADELDERVDAFVKRMLDGPLSAVRWTKMAINVGLKQLAHSVLEVSTALEQASNRSGEHRLAVDAARNKTQADFRAYRAKRGPR